MKVEINIIGNPIEIAKKKILVEELATLDTASLDKLVQLKRSTKAVNYLKNNWQIVKSFLGI